MAALKGPLVEIFGHWLKNIPFVKELHTTRLYDSFVCFVKITKLKREQFISRLHSCRVLLSDFIENEKKYTIKT